MVNPKMPSSLSPSTISVGYSSACSRACAFGMISLSTKLRTVDRISCWMSVRSAVCARRVIARSSGTPVSVVTGEYEALRAARPGGFGHGEGTAVTVAAVRPRLLAAAVAVLLRAGCGSSSSSGTTASGTSSEPSPAQAEASREAAADPAAATDPQSAALAVALRAADLPAGWRVQANPVPDGDLSKNPSLVGICGFAFTSEAHRVAKYPVVGVDATGSAQLSSEAIAYDGSDAATTAVQELVQAFSGCPADQYTFLPAPGAEGLAENSVVFQYELTGGVTQVVVAQARGAALPVLIGEDPTTTTAAARSVATRLAALPAAAIGL